MQIINNHSEKQKTNDFFYKQFDSLLLIQLTTSFLQGYFYRLKPLLDIPNETNKRDQEIRNYL